MRHKIIIITLIFLSYTTMWSSSFHLSPPKLKISLKTKGNQMHQEGVGWPIYQRWSPKPTNHNLKQAQPAGTRIRFGLKWTSMSRGIQKGILTSFQSWSITGNPVILFSTRISRAVEKGTKEMVTKLNYKNSKIKKLWIQVQQLHIYLYLFIYIYIYIY